MINASIPYKYVDVFSVIRPYSAIKESVMTKTHAISSATTSENYPYST